MYDLLDGVRVLDIGQSAAGQYCAKLLCDAGAEVVHVELNRDSAMEPSNDFDPAFAFYNADKRFVAVNENEPEGSALLRRLIEWADILIDDRRPGELEQLGFGPNACLASNQDLVYVSITPYGHTGPQSRWAATELTNQAAAGLSHGNGAEGREPLRYPGNMAGNWAGANAAVGAVAALRHVRRGGWGQHIDVSIQESLATTFFFLWADYEYQGVLQQRGQKELLPAADGWIYPRWQPSVPWEVYVLAFDAPGLAVDEELQPPRGMIANAELVAETLSEHTKLRTRREWIDVAVEHGIPLGFLQSPNEVLACPQLEARRFFDRMHTPTGAEIKFPGRPYVVDGHIESADRTLPRREHAASFGDMGLRVDPSRSGPQAEGRGPDPGAGALAELRVLDNGIVQAGTFPARVLADLGAEVIRVENYHSPDGTRNGTMPDGVAGREYWNQGGVFHEQHRNKTYSLGLDVTIPQGREAFLRVVAQCDVVLDSHPPGVLDRLGLGYEDLRTVRPDIVFVNTSGYGEGGPYSQIRSYGMFTELAAISWFNGYRGEEPRRGGAPLTDHPSALHIAFVMLAALERRDRTGLGCKVDVSQYEIGINMLGDLYVAEAAGMPAEPRIGNEDPGATLSGCFRSAGRDRWLTISVDDAQALAVLAQVVGVQRSDDTQAMREAVSKWAGVRDPYEATYELQRHGIAASPVNDVRDLLLDDHLREREFFWLVEHSPRQERVGARAFPGAPFRMAETPPRLYRHAPLLGEHNRELATGLLGYSAEKYAAMVDSGAFGQTPRAAAAVPPPADISARLGLSPWVYLLRAGEVDPEFKSKLRDRFGPTFGS